MKKNIFVLFLIFVMAFVLGGCSEPKEDNKEYKLDDIVFDEVILFHDEKNVIELDITELIDVKENIKAITLYECDKNVSGKMRLFRIQTKSGRLEIYEDNYVYFGKWYYTLEFEFEFLVDLFEPEKLEFTDLSSEEKILLSKFSKNETVEIEESLKEDFIEDLCKIKRVKLDKEKFNLGKKTYEIRVGEYVITVYEHNQMMINDELYALVSGSLAFLEKIVVDSGDLPWV